MCETQQDCQKARIREAFEEIEESFLVEEEKWKLIEKIKQCVLKLSHQFILKPFDQKDMKKKLYDFEEKYEKDKDYDKIIKYIENKITMLDNQLSFSNAFISAALAFAAITIAVFEVYKSLAGNVNDKLVYWPVTILLIIFAVLTICFAICHIRNSNKKSFYEICLKILEQYIPPKNEVNNSQNLKCSVKTNSKHKKNKK